MQLIKPLILASRSPRRLSLLRQIGIEPVVMDAQVPEEFDPTQSPVENALRLSYAKARAVELKVPEGIIIGADTIVVLDHQLLAKPQDEDDAFRMLQLLSGKTHVVITGFTLMDRPSGMYVCAHEETRVTFRELPEEEIREYIATGSPMDKAGAYGIQDDYGAVFVTRIEGCFYNVVGFPLARFYSTLADFQRHLTSTIAQDG